MQELPHPRLGIDLGGTKTEIVALRPDGGTVLRRRAPTPSDDYGAIIRLIRDLIAAADAELGQAGTVGIGMPGVISPATGLVKNANTVVLNRRPFDRDLVEALGRDVRLENDANCLALSEAVDGAGAGARCVFGVIIGTGTGGGVAVDGRVLTGPNRVAGEWGHNPLPWPDAAESAAAPSCYCGLSGCLETWISGTGFAADHKRTTGRDWRAERIVEARTAGDAEADAAYRRYANRLGRALATVVNVLDPDVIVLGGGMGNVESLLEDLPPIMTSHAFTDTLVTRLARPRHGDSSGVRGAAWLWGGPPAGMA